MSIINANHIFKKYKDNFALNGFNLELKKGEVLGLIGPNGSGKTTFINIVCSLIKKDSGTINVFSQENLTREIKRKIGLVPQDLVYFEELTVRENIDFFCGLYENNKKIRKAMVDDAIKLTQLSAYEKALPKSLSGGLKRRLNIACGIAHKPELIILDEPTVAVDAQTRNFILSSLKNMAHDGSSILYTTHYMEEVEIVADRIIIIKDGQNVAEGTLDELQNLIETTEKVTLELGDHGENLDLLKELQNLSSVTFNNNQYHLAFVNNYENIGNVLHFLQEHHLSYIHIYSNKPSLNDIFLALTGKELTE